MDDLELFDVFNEDNNPEPQQKTIQSTSTVREKKSKKEKKKEKSKDSNQNGHHRKRSHDDLSNKSDVDGEVDEMDSTRITKKPRKNTEQPIVVDSFETESDQVLPATAGLQGTVPTNDNIVIKKKVYASIFVGY